MSTASQAMDGIDIEKQELHEQLPDQGMDRLQLNAAGSDFATLLIEKDRQLAYEIVSALSRCLTLGSADDAPPSVPSDEPAVSQPLVPPRENLPKSTLTVQTSPSPRLQALERRKARALERNTSPKQLSPSQQQPEARIIPQQPRREPTFRRTTTLRQPESTEVDEGSALYLHQATNTLASISRQPDDMMDLSEDAVASSVRSYSEGEGHQHQQVVEVEHVRSVWNQRIVPDLAGGRHSLATGGSNTSNDASRRLIDEAGRGTGSATTQGQVLVVGALDAHPYLRGQSILGEERSSVCHSSISNPLDDSSNMGSREASKGGSVVSVNTTARIQNVAPLLPPASTTMDALYTTRSGAILPTNFDSFLISEDFFAASRDSLQERVSSWRK